MGIPTLDPDPYLVKEPRSFVSIVTQMTLHPYHPEVVIEKPLHLDSLVENRSRLSFARICIEVDWNSEFPKFVLLNLGYGKYTTVRIEYPLVPHSCSHCQVFGHKTFQFLISKVMNAKTVPDSFNVSGCNGTRHANGKETIADSRARNHKGLKPVKDPDGGVEGIIDSISDAQASPSRLSPTSQSSIDPGPEGFSSLFLKRAWRIFGSEVSAAVADFFESGCMLREINHTIIALVPKVPNPRFMHDYRPISCCNTIYKCILKIIAARIKRCLPDIICPTQTDFVHGRSIADKILLT